MGMCLFINAILVEERKHPSHRFQIDLDIYIYIKDDGGVEGRGLGEKQSEEMEKDGGEEEEDTSNDIVIQTKEKISLSAFTVTEKL